MRANKRAKIFLAFFVALIFFSAFSEAIEYNLADNLDSFHLYCPSYCDLSIDIPSFTLHHTEYFSWTQNGGNCIVKFITIGMEWCGHDKINNPVLVSGPFASFEFTPHNSFRASFHRPRIATVDSYYCENRIVPPELNTPVTISIKNVLGSTKTTSLNINEYRN